jgi:hypothetical protein
VRTIRTRLALGLAIVAAVVVVPAASAGSDPPTGVGWWTSENAGLPTGLVPTLLPQSGGPVGAVPSDIPPGGFEVAKAGAVESYAALSYDAYDGAVPTKVVLRIHQPAANVPGSKLQACPLDGNGTFGDARGDPLTAGPSYDCAEAVAGVEDTAAGTLTFDVAPLSEPDRLAIAVVAADGSRVVFDPPDTKTVVVSTGGRTAPVSDLALEPVGGAPAFDDPGASLAVPDVSFSEPPITPAAPRAAPRRATAPPAPERVALAAVTHPSASTGAGSAVVGAILVVLGAGFAAARNRRLRGDG